MAETPYLSLILPAFNEVGRIAGTIDEAERYLRDRGLTHEIIVSADGTDGTRERVTELAREIPNLRVIGQAARRGKGRGIREAVRVAGGQVIGFSDADNKTPIEEFDRFDPLLRAGWDLVIGSRAFAESTIERPQPLHRQIGSRGFGVIMHAIVGLHDIIDTQCGFKFFQGPVARDLFGRQRIDGYMVDVEILYLAQKAGYRIAQLPIRWRDDGDSRLQLVRGNIRNITDVLRIRFAAGGRSARPVAKRISRE